MGQDCALRHAGGPARVKNQCRVFRGIHVHPGWLRACRPQGIVERHMPFFMMIGPGNLSEDRPEETFNGAEIGSDVTDHDRFHFCSLQGRHRKRVERRVVHDEDGLGARVFELKMQLRGLVERVAGYGYRPCLENPEKNGGVMREIGQKDGHPIFGLDPAGTQEMSDPVRGVFDLGECTFGAGENGIGRSRIVPCRAVQDREQGFFIARDLIGHAFRPSCSMPGFFHHSHLLPPWGAA